MAQLTAKQSEGSATQTDGAKQTTKASKQSIGKLRDQCQNSCHLTAMVLADPKVTEDCHLLYLGCKVVRRDAASTTHLSPPNKKTKPKKRNKTRHESSKMAKSLKCMDAAVEYYVASAFLRSSYLTSIGALLQPWQHAEDLEFCGLTMHMDKKEAARLAEDSPVVIHDTQRCAAIMKFLMVTVSRCLRGNLTGSLTYPLKFAKLLTLDALERQEAMQEMKQDWEAWLQIKDKGGFWKVIVKRSPYEWTVVRETFELLVVSGWAWRADVEAQITRTERANDPRPPADCANPTCWFG